MSAVANITRAALHDALVWLEQRGAIESLRAGDGRIRYRRRPDFDEDALRRLADVDATWDMPSGSDRRH